MPSSSDSSKQMGRLFSWFAWIAALFVLYWTFDNFLQNKENPNQQVLSYQENGNAVVVLEQNSRGHYIANGFINGREVTFLLDTGATQVAVPGRLAGQLGLTQGTRVQVRTANGIANAFQTEVAELELGEIRLNNVAATIVPDYDSRHILLGMSALRSLEFTQRNETLTIRQ
ncbi:TIGR02281 family clan AA aspartic protease [Aliidiomarina iranensis]|uniref:TIGR02281 family clan AA aspartic protease n=1 Tax=Aliidiomarina iranensis TaxID=1434071 RepID=A0A432W2X3_9GAMM|nr:TIGR02281 family clan AA aspartic protease [Aliidiomarina iranensis]RUO23544.1 TIGR02281 family clan AA aspartic protease [Aliidiomarina iranensis]